MDANYTKHNLIFGVMLGSTFMQWAAAPAAVVFVLASTSLVGCMAATVVFVGIGTVKAFVLSAIPLCLLDPATALVLCPAVLWREGLTARFLIAVGAWVRIWWQGSAAQDVFAVQKQTSSLAPVLLLARRPPSTF